MLFSACNKHASPRANELNLFIQERPSSFDPADAVDNYTIAEVSKVYESLYEFHPFRRPYEIVPNLAEAMPEQKRGGNSFVIRLRKGVHFHYDLHFPGGKGREITASDVVYSLARLADPRRNHKGYWVIENKIMGLEKWRAQVKNTVKLEAYPPISGLRALDNYTLEIDANTDAASLVNALAMIPTAIVSREMVKHYGDDFSTHPRGTGAFLLAAYAPTGDIVYSKNKNFRDKKFPSNESVDSGKPLPLVDRIVVRVLSESQPLLQNFFRGKGDLLTLPSDLISDVVQGQTLKAEHLKKGFKLSVDPMIDVNFFGFNHEKKIFRDRRVREAISIAYNREEANRLFFGGSARSAQSIIPPGLAGHEEGYQNPATKFDLGKSKELLRAAGFPEGKGISELTLLLSGGGSTRLIGEHFSRCLAALGIRVRVELLPWGEFLRRINKGESDFFFMAWSADYPDAGNFLQLLSCDRRGDVNRSRFCDQRFEKLYRSALALPLGPERSKIYQELNRLVGLELPWVFGFHRSQFNLIQPWVRNFQYMEFPTGQFPYLGIDH